MQLEDGPYDIGFFAEGYAEWYEDRWLWKEEPSTKQLRWQAGYAAERITGRTLDLTRFQSDEFVQDATRALNETRPE